MPVLPRAAAALLCLPLAAGAFTLAGGPVAARYDSVERLGGVLQLNREQGRLRGFALAAAADAGPVTVDLRVERLAGTLGYDGFTQFGLPLQTSTRLVRRTADLALAPAQAWSVGPLALRPALLAQTLALQRAIQPSASSAPLTETLRRHALGLQLAAEAKAGPLALGATLAGAWPLSQRIAVDSFGVLDPFVLHPAGGDRRALRLAASWPLAGGWSLEAEAARESDRFGESPAVLATRGGTPAALALYPGSRQWTSRAALALRHAWR